MSLTVSDLVRDVRRMLNEITMSGEYAAFDNQHEDGFASNFDDETLENWLLDGARYVAARVKAAFLPELSTSVNPTSALTFDTEVTGMDYPIYRILNTRVALNGKKAFRRTLNDYLKEDGGDYSNTNPIYVASDGEFIVAGSDEWSNDGVINAGATAQAVLVPMFGGDASFDGISWSGTSKTLPLDNRFREAVIQYAVSTAFTVKNKLPESVMAWGRLKKLLDPYRLQLWRTSETN